MKKYLLALILFLLPTLTFAGTVQIESGGGGGLFQIISGAAFPGDITDVGDCSQGACFTAAGSGNILDFEGSTADDFETRLSTVDPTTDNTATLPDASGFICIDDQIVTNLDGTNLEISSQELRVIDSPNFAGSVNVAVNLTVQDTTSSTDIWTREVQMSLNNSDAIHSEGKFHWNDDDKTLEIDSEITDLHFPVNQVLTLRGNNQTGVTLTAGQVVYVNGAQGNRPTFTLALGDTEETSHRTIGLIATDILDSANGYIIADGIIRNIDTSKYSVGAELFLSSTTTGAYTSLRANAPAHPVEIGIVIVSNATIGSIQLNIDTGEILEELHDVNGGSPSQSNLLSYNGDAPFWTPTTSINLFKGSFSGNLFVGSNATITNSFVADSTLFVEDGNVGIGTVVINDAGTDPQLTLSGVVPAIHFVDETAGHDDFFLGADNDKIAVSVGGSKGSSINLWAVSSGGDVEIRRDLDVGNDLTIDTNSLFVDASLNQVGINTVLPLTDLHVGTGTGVLSWFDTVFEEGILIDPDVNIGRVAIVGDAQADIFLYDTSAGTDIKGIQYLTRDGFTTFRGINDASTAFTHNFFVLDHSTGATGIATTSPLFLFQVGNILTSSYFSVDSSGNATTSGRLLVGATSPALDALFGAGDLYVGDDATITNALTLASLNCTGFDNGGKLTTDANGKVTCENDNSTVGGGGINDWKVLTANAQDYLTTTTSLNVYLPANLGIGTTTPQALLSISNPAGALFGNSLLFQVASTTNTLISNILTVTADGYVGIGTANPRGPLEVDAGLGGWNFRVKITVASAEVDATLTDFPVYLDLDDLADSFFASVATDGSDIRVTRSDGTTEVAREVVAIDTAAKTGQLFFMANSLSSSVDTDFYIYYGNNTATEPSAGAANGSQNVWDSNFRAVYHMEEDPSGSAPQMIDSTSNGFNGTSEGTMTGGDLVAGKIDNNLDFDGTDDAIGLGDAGDIGSSNHTIEGWFKQDSTSGNGGLVATQEDSGGTFVGWNFFKSTQKIQVVGRPVTDTGTTMNMISTGNELTSTAVRYHLVWTKAGFATANQIVYKNANVVTMTVTLDTALDADWDSNFDMHIGTRGATGTEFNGQADEIRYSTSVRSADWVSATYSNINVPLTFYSISAEETGLGNELSETPSPPKLAIFVDTDANVGIADASPLSLFTVGDGDKFQIDGSGNVTSTGWFNIGTTDLVGTIPGLFGSGDLFVGNNATVTGNLRVEGTLDSSDTVYRNLKDEVIFTVTEGDRVGEDETDLVIVNQKGENVFKFKQDGTLVSKNGMKKAKQNYWGLLGLLGLLTFIRKRIE